MQQSPEAIMELFGALFASITDGLVVLDKSGRCKSVNAAAERLLGRTRDELLGRALWEVYPGASGSLRERESRRAIAGNAPVVFEDYWKPAERWLETSLYPFRRGCLIAQFRDITEKRRLEELLRASEERSWTYFDLGLIGIAITSADKRTLEANDQLCRILGYERRELLQMSWAALTHPDDVAADIYNFNRVIAGEIDGYSIDKRFIRKDGEIIFATISVKCVRDVDGSVDYFIALVQDITARKRAEEIKRASEERWRSVFENSAMGIAVTDANGYFTAANRAFQELIGYTEEELRSLCWIEIIYEEDRPARSALSLKPWENTSRPITREKRFRRKNGQLIWVRVTVSLHPGSETSPHFRVAMVEDITERKRSEAALRDSEERFRRMADTAPVMIWIAGLDKLCTFFNKPWLEFTGRPLEQELGNGWLDRVHPEDLNRCLAIYFLSFDARRSFQMQYRLRRADGEYRWILDHGSPVYSAGEFTGYIGSCMDITDQKLIEDQMRASELRLMEAQRLANVGSWERDLADDRMLWSDEMLRILGLRNDAPSNFQEFLSCVHAGDWEAVLEADRKILSTDAPVDTEYRIVRPNGEVRILRSIVEAIRNDQGVPVRIVGATQDMTDVRRAQQQDFVRQKLESLGTLAGGIAHDFNNLLGSVLAQADLALDELDAGSPPKEELQAIREVAIRGSEIVRQLMIYAGKEGGAVELVDASRVVREMLGLLKLSVSKHATLETDLGRQIPAIRVNPAQLRQVMMNLVTNASDAIGTRDGVIRVTTSSVTIGPESPVAIPQQLPEGDYVQLEVSDTGHGMTQETQDKVFDPFFTTKSAGHGLGLAIVHGIVRDLGGGIHIASEPGKGATFQILLPSAATTVDAIEAPVSRAAKRTYSSQTAAVLVVEDEDSLRQSVVKMLRKTGFEVLEAGDGSAALELLRANGGNIGAMLLDMTIPGASSHEVIAAAIEGRPDVRVVLTSAYSAEMVTADQSLPHVRAFIRKPFHLGDLVQVLREALSFEN